MPTTPEVEDDKGARTGSRHKRRNMISLSPRWYDLLRQLAQKNLRPIAWEARIAIGKALVDAGLMTKEEAARLEDEEGDAPAG